MIEIFQTLIRKSNNKTINVEMDMRRRICTKCINKSLNALRNNGTKGIWALIRQARYNDTQNTGYVCICVNT